MADVYTSQSSTGLSQLIWKKALLFPYREEAMFTEIAVKESTTEGGTRGKGVTHTFVNDIALATAPIDEIVGPEAVTYTNSTKTFTLKEYANTMKSTALARTTGFVDLDTVLANLLGYNAGASLDTIDAAVLAATTNIQRANGRATNGAIVATDVLTVAELEIAATELRVLNVPKIGGMYNLYVHPYQLHDLRQDPDWRDARIQGGNDFQSLQMREVGYIAGFRIIESTRSPLTANIGSGSTVDVYKALAVGADALALSYSDHPEAPGSTPEVRFGLATDALMRNKPVSWYALRSTDILRDASVRAIYTASSRGANS